MRRLLLISISFLLFACHKQGRKDWPNFYADNFEAYDHIDSTVDGNNELWSYFQITDEENEVAIDSSVVHSGSRSFRSKAVPGYDGSASKASLNKQFMAFWEDEVVRIDFWCYLVGNASAEWLFLCDLEEKVNVGAGPGMRLALVEDELLVEHKYPNPNIAQPDETAVKFPRDQWVNIVFETKLSRKKTGYVKVWQDGILVINQDNWKTLPKDMLYFNQGTRGGYSQIEFGITANTQDNEMVMYVDDIVVEVVP